MSESYSCLAPYYDRLMSDIDYDEICRHIISEAEKNGIAGKRILDIGCGTGEVSIRLAKAGYNVTALDISSEMLALCDKKARDAGVKLIAVEQDMTSLNLPYQYDIILCCLDGMNYIVREHKLISCLKGVKKYLLPDGIFIFDMNTPHKFENVYGNRDYILESDGVLCAWQNYYDSESKLCDFELSLFVKEDSGCYRRLNETQTERCYSEKEIKSALLKSGLSLKSFDVLQNGERWVIMATK